MRHLLQVVEALDERGQILIDLLVVWFSGSPLQPVQAEVIAGSLQDGALLQLGELF